MKILTILFCILPIISCAKILYVDGDNVTPGDGLSWESSYADIQDAIDSAEASDSIWVKKGTYLPTKAIPGYDMYSNAFHAFQMKRWITLIGGFDGTEASFSDRDRKKVFSENLTILSGNNYHIRVMHNEDELFNDTVVEGFVVEGGEANGNGNIDRFYPGIESNGGVFKNLIIRNNFAADSGGALHIYGKGTVVNCIIYGNLSGGFTPAGLSTSAEVDIYNCTIVGNSNLSSPINTMLNNGNMYNSLIWGNTNDFEDDEIQISASNNCTIANCAIEDVVNDQPVYAIGNINLGSSNNGSNGPRMADPVEADFSLTTDSPCVNAGSNLQVIDNPYDIFGNDRIIDGQVDIGAIEYSGVSSTFLPNDYNPNVKVFPNPSNGTFQISGIAPNRIIETRIMDAKGVYLGNLKFDESNLFRIKDNRGLFLLQLITKSGIITRRVIIN